MPFLTNRLKRKNTKLIRTYQAYYCNEKKNRTFIEKFYQQLKMKKSTTRLVCLKYLLENIFVFWL